MSPPETRRGGPAAAPSESILHQRDNLHTASALTAQAPAALATAMSPAWQPDPRPGLREGCAMSRLRPLGEAAARVVARMADQSAERKAA